MPEATPDVMPGSLGGGGDSAVAVAPAPSSGRGAPPPIDSRPGDGVPQKGFPKSAQARSLDEDVDMMAEITRKPAVRRGHGNAPAADLAPPAEDEDLGVEDEADSIVDDENPEDESEAPPEGEADETEALVVPEVDQKIKVGDKEYGSEDVAKLAKKAGDMDYLQNVFRAYPGAREEVLKILSNASKYGRGSQAAAGRGEAAPVAPPSPNEVDEVIKGLPEDLREPLSRVTAAMGRRHEAVERQNAELRQELSELREIQNDGLVDTEFSALAGWAKDRGLPAPDRGRVEAASDELGNVPLDVAYKHAYFDEISVHLKGRARAAAPVSPIGAAAKVAAGVPARNGAANGHARTIPRPGSPARSSAPPPKKLGDMQDSEFDAYAMDFLRGNRRPVR